MLQRLARTVLVLAVLVAPALAAADYVCSAAYFPGTARARLITSSGPSCTGTTTTYWICDAAGSSTSCGYFSYTAEELQNLHASLARAADTQQSVTVGLTTCRSGGAGWCFYYASFGN